MLGYWGDENGYFCELAFVKRFSVTVSVLFQLV